MTIAESRKALVRAHKKRDYATALEIVRSNPAIVYAKHLEPEQIIYSNFRKNEGTPFTLVWTSCNNVKPDWPRFKRMIKRKPQWLDTWDVNPHGANLLCLASGGHRPDIVLYLLKQGMDANSESIGTVLSGEVVRGGGKPIGWAVGNGGFEAAEHLLDHGADILDADIHWPAMKGQHHGVRFLLDRGFPVNKRVQGNTPLHEAARRSNSVRTVELLLDRSAKLNAKNGDGKTALTIAISKKKQKVVAYLKDRGAKK